MNWAVWLLILYAAPVFAFSVTSNQNPPRTISLKAGTGFGDSCFTKGQGSIVDLNYKELNGDIWGDGNNESTIKIEVADKDAYGFNASGCGATDPDWEKFRVPSKGVLVLKGTVTVLAGTKIEVDRGVSIRVDATLDVQGASGKPVIIKGTGWNGLYVPSGGKAQLSYCTVNGGGQSFLVAGGIPGDWGGAIFVSGGSLDMAHCTVKNGDGLFGGGVGIFNSTQNTIKASSITGNKGTYGGGVAMVSGSVDMQGTQVTGNSEARLGGGLFVSGGAPTLTRLVVAKNEAMGGGGLYVKGSPGVTQLGDSVVSNNTGSQGGGGILLDGGGDVRLVNDTVVRNLAPKGGGLYVDGTSRLRMRNSILWGNALKEDGPTPYVGPQGYIATANEDVSIRNGLVAGGISGFGYGGGASAAMVDAGGLLPAETEPLFRSPSSDPGSDGGGSRTDWSAKPGSPTVNAGDNVSYDAATFGNLGLGGFARIYNQGVVDLGAYEFPNNPPSLGSAAGTTREVSVSEDDDQVVLRLCQTGSTPVVESHPQVSGNRQVPFEREAGIGVIVSSLPPELTLSGGQTSGYGVLKQFGGDQKRINSAGTAVADGEGRVVYEPPNRVSMTPLVLHCALKDRIIKLNDSGEEEDDPDHSLPS
ncbi:MAG TPA: right-handed parallel beta-helix repeat-containing protein, partial [Gammaproteobacteria bacterium]|nr:right-handed parallel beta-helix repeat-containing protein [Gammaproteobacteria bacterium]